MITLVHETWEQTYLNFIHNDLPCTNWIFIHVEEENVALQQIKLP